MPRYMVVTIGGAEEIMIQPINEFNTEWQWDGIKVSPPDVIPARWSISKKPESVGIKVTDYCQLGVFIRSQIGAAHFITIFDLDDHVQHRRTMINLIKLHTPGGQQI